MQVEPAFPEVQRLTNLGESGTPTGVNPDPYTFYWHADGSGARIPARYTVLYAMRVPSDGGETSFVNMYAACAALSPTRRRALAGRHAIHDAVVARHFRHGTPVAPASASLRHKLGMRMRLVGRMLSPRSIRHPVIRVHEETGRSSLYLGDHAWRVTRCWWPAGVRLVNELNTFATTHAEWTYTHTWQVGDLVIWDNRCLLHRASAYDSAGQERDMLRAVVSGLDARADT
jgi:alpha-ketoglutarate-dependent taurine dioxygenase